MSDAPNLPINVAAGTAGHAQLHNDVNRSVNTLARVIGPRDLTGLLPGVFAHKARSLVFHRVGPLVTLVIACDDSETSDAMDGMDLPEGIRPIQLPDGPEGSGYPLPAYTAVGIVDDGTPNPTTGTPVIWGGVLRTSTGVSAEPTLATFTYATVDDPELAADLGTPVNA